MEVYITLEGSLTNGGYSLSQRLSTIPRYASDTSPDQAGLRKEQGRIPFE
jgi:hypothetical protein